MNQPIEREVAGRECEDLFWLMFWLGVSFFFTLFTYLFPFILSISASNILQPLSFLFSFFVISNQSKAKCLLRKTHPSLSRLRQR